MISKRLITQMTRTPCAVSDDCQITNGLKEAPKNVDSSIRCNFDSVSNVSDGSQGQSEKYNLHKTSIAD
jgi:hypothetical protein